MPSLGADMEEGTVVEWLVKPGDEVHRGDVVAVVETEKSTIEVEIFENGVLDELIVQPGTRVPVGAVLAHVVAQAPGAVPTPQPPSAMPARAPAPTPAPPTAIEEAGPTRGWPPVAPPGGPPPTHSPVVRHLAEQLGVDLAALTGSWPGGTVTRADVEQAAMASGGEALHRQQAGP